MTRISKSKKNQELEFHLIFASSSPAECCAGYVVLVLLVP